MFLNEIEILFNFDLRKIVTIQTLPFY